ncbi:MAG: hypothetical protein JST82_08460 [Bacteroidetes bacterium]|nr:hypothetical protein [Bacteroidota bacterium]
MRLLCCIYLLILSVSSRAQNYINYYHINNRADECIVRGDYKTAAIKLDSLYSGYSFVYARHCFKALQIACVLNDTPQVYKWLTKCFLQGIPLWQVRANAITTTVQNYPRAYKIINSYDSLYKIYQSHINLPLARTIDNMFAHDQKLTGRVNDGFFLWKLYDYSRWRHNNRKQYRTIQAFIKQYGYPGEKIIGLSESDRDSVGHYKFFVRRGHLPIISNDLQFMLQHCYSNPRKDIQQELLKQVEEGNLPHNQYAVFVDYMVKYGRQKYGNYQPYHYWPFKFNPEDTAVINARCQAIGLPTLQQRHIQVAQFDSALKYNIRNMIFADL